MVLKPKIFNFFQYKTHHGKKRLKRYTSEQNQYRSLIKENLTLSDLRVDQVGEQNR